MEARSSGVPSASQAEATPGSWTTIGLVIPKRMGLLKQLSRRALITPCVWVRASPASAGREAPATGQRDRVRSVTAAGGEMNFNLDFPWPDLGATFVSRTNSSFCDATRDRCPDRQLWEAS